MHTISTQLAALGGASPQVTATTASGPPPGLSSSRTGNPAWLARSPMKGLFQTFGDSCCSDTLCLICSPASFPVAGQEAGSRLLHIQQGPRTISAYVVEFRTLAATTRWEDSALRCVFRRVTEDELVREKPTNLN